MSQDELAVMDGSKCILQLRGVRPFLSDKYDITQHPNYKYTADDDPENAFDIEGYANNPAYACLIETQGCSSLGTAIAQSLHRSVLGQAAMRFLFLLQLLKPY